jgi:hypothetical protein
MVMWLFWRRYENRALVVKGKERLIRPRHRWEENIKISFGEIGVIWHMTRGSGGCCYTVMNSHIPLIRIISSLMTCCFLKRGSAE